MTYTVVHRTSLDSAGARVQGLKRLPFAEGLFETSASSGTVESPILEAPAPFDDLVGSWNAEVPRGGRLTLQAQVRTAKGWTGWFVLGSAEGRTFSSPGRQEGPAGWVDIDTLRLKAPATAFRYRVLLKAGKGPARLRLVAVSVSGGEAPVDPPPFSPGPWVRELKVRPRSQMEEQERYRHDICSPTALAMGLEFWGRKRSTVRVAEAVKDAATGKFGVWPFNAAVAGASGLEAWVARLPGLAALQAEVAAGRPVVASLTFKEGELSGAPLKRTKGHLVLVAGFTREGDVIVLDPAAPDRRSARRVYLRGEFHRAWRRNKRGLAYLLGPLEGRRLSVGVPAAHLWAGPTEGEGLRDLSHLSQLLYGETVTVRAARGEWVRVLADEQASYLPEERWQGYPGWMRAEDLVSAAPPASDVVVRTRQALLHVGPDILALSVGTRLERVSEEKGVSRVRLLDGSLAEVPSDSLAAPRSEPPEEARHRLVKTAELFLGTSYYWGGRSGVQEDASIGADCSGLVSLAYRTQGLDIPRDAHEQKLRSRPLKRAELRPGDLVFLTRGKDPGRVTHVMIYTGGDGLIESRAAAGRALRSSFTERFGLPLSRIESGDLVTDLTLDKPRQRRVYFGGYL